MISTKDVQNFAYVFKHETDIGSVLTNLRQSKEINSVLVELYKTIVADHDFVIVPEHAKEILTAQPQIGLIYWEKFRSLVCDPGNPTKEQKYLYALCSILRAMKIRFGDWSNKVMGFLEQTRHSNSFANHAFCALAALDIFPDDDRDLRIQYAYILHHVRAALDLMENTDLKGPQIDAVKELLLFFGYAKFTEGDLFPFIYDFVVKALRAPQPDPFGAYELPDLSFHNLADSIRQANLRLMNVHPIYKQASLAREWKKLMGMIGCHFDPNAYSNPPWVLLEQEYVDGTKCGVLRHGTPTRDSGITDVIIRIACQALGWASPQSARVISDFESFLKAEPNKKTLYIDHQDGESRSAEPDRMQAIQGLEDRFGNFFYLSLPMDGQIWQVEGVKIDQLKDCLFYSVVHQRNGFSLPRGEVPEEETVRNLLNDVHRLYFNNSELHDNSLKQAFIAMFYSELKDYYKCHLGANFVTSTCKDSKDRGNVSSVIDMIKYMILLRRENNPEDLMDVFITVLGPFIIKGEEIVPKRLEILLNVTRHLARLTEGQKELIRRDSLMGPRIKNQSIPKGKVQWAQVVGPKRFIRYVENMRDLREKRVIFDPDFQSKLASTFLSDGYWQLPALRKTISVDLLRMEIRVNGRRMLTFEEVCQSFQLSPALFNQPVPEDNPHHPAISLMCMLHQGTALESMKDPCQFFGGNQANLVVAQRAPIEARAAVINLIGHINFHAAFDETLLSQEGIGPYLFSAVRAGLLSPRFMPRENFEQVLPIYATRLEATFMNERQVIKLEQELVLRTPSNSVAYPIDMTFYFEAGKGARIYWGFN